MTAVKPTGELTAEEWRARYVAHIVGKLTTPPTDWTLKEAIAAALNDYDAQEDYDFSPEDSADDSMDAWGDGL